jgi:VWFA-related protein
MRTAASPLRAGAILAAALACAAPSRAQAPTPAGQAVRETAAATVIEIPVTVVGKDGHPVTGLTAADFELYDEGKKQTIASVDVIDLSRPAAAAAPPAGAGAGTPEAAPIPPAARRLWLLVFDLSYASVSGLTRAREGARDFVMRSMKENDLAAVGTLSVDTGWRLLVNFTRDRGQLAAAVDTLGIPSLIHPSPDPLVFAFSDPRAAEAGVSQNPYNGGIGAGAFQDAMRDLQTLRRKSNDELLRGRATTQVSTLAGIGRVLDSVRGRKHVLFFSEGFESRLLNGHSLAQTHDGSEQALSAQDSTTAMGAGDASLSGEIWKIDNDARFGSTASRDLLAAALTQFTRSDSVIDAVDIGGLRADGDPSPRNEGGTDTLFTMAADTGGDFVRNANQLGGELEKVADRTSLVYLLVYSPRVLTRPGAFHALKVTAKVSGAKVIARSGYYEPRPYRSLSPLEKILSAGDLLTGGESGSRIDLRLTTAAFASPSETPQVPIVLEVPGPSLLAGETAEKSGVQIYAYANDARGNLVDYVASELALDLSRARPTLEASGLKFYGTLYLPPGDYGLRVLVRNTSTGHAGIASARLAVPAIPGGAPSVLPPFFPEPAGHWLMVRGNPRADAPARPADYPFALGGESFIPSALPHLGNGADAQIAVVAYNFGSAGKPAPLAVDLRIVGADGKEIAAPARADKASDVERGGGQKRMYTLHPTGLPPGRYALKVVVTDTATHSSAESASPFDVR